MGGVAGVTWALGFRAYLRFRTIQGLGSGRWCLVFRLGIAFLGEVLEGYKNWKSCWGMAVPSIRGIVCFARHR